MYNHHHENLLKKWSSSSKTFSLMHSLASQYYTKINNILGIPTILIGAVTASSIFSSASSLDDSAVYRNYINGFLALTVTALSGISKFLGVNEKIVKHTTASFKNTKISMDIDTLLSISRSERTENPTVFINKIKTSLLEIREHAPDIPPSILDDFIKRLDSSLLDTRVDINRNNSDDNQEQKEEEEECSNIEIDIPCYSKKIEKVMMGLEK